MEAFPTLHIRVNNTIRSCHLQKGQRDKNVLFFSMLELLVLVIARVLPKRLGGGRLTTVTFGGGADGGGVAGSGGGGLFWDRGEATGTLAGAFFAALGETTLG